LADPLTAVHRFFDSIDPARPPAEGSLFSSFTPECSRLAILANDITE
jgi:hypothetical protein